MNTSEYLLQEKPHTGQYSAKKTSKISFSSFQKIILANSAMRKQVKDVVDLALFDFALKQNTALIESMREKAEAESVKLMMQFVKGVPNYELFSKTIHRNRIIKTLAALDKRDQAEMIYRVTHSVAV
jgi:hypothetical protein